MAVDPNDIPQEPVDPNEQGFVDSQDGTDAELIEDETQQLTTESSIAKDTESRVAADSESRVSEFITRTLKQTNSDPFYDLRNELELFKEKFTDDPKQIRYRGQEPSALENLDGLLTKTTRLTAARVTADYDRLTRDVTTRLETAQARTGFVTNPGAREYLEVLGAGDRGQLVMFQLQNKTIAAGIARSRTSLEITTQFTGSTQSIFNREALRADGSATTALGILGPNRAFAQATEAMEAKAEKQARSRFYGVQLEDGALMHAKLGYTETADRGLRSAFLGTQNITTALDKANTQEEGLFLTLTVKESLDTQSIKYQIANEIRTVSKAITYASSTFNGQAISMGNFSPRVSALLSLTGETRQYIKVGDEIQTSYLQAFEDIAADKTRSLAINMQYVEKFLTATDYAGTNDNSWRGAVLTAFEQLAADGRLSLTLSETSISKELGYTRLIEKLLDGDTGNSQAKQLILNLVAQDRIRLIPTGFLHTKSWYEYTRATGAGGDLGPNRLIRLGTGSANLGSRGFTSADKNFETAVILDDEAINDIGVNREDVLANTAFGSTGQMLAIQRYSRPETVNRLYQGYRGKSTDLPVLNDINQALADRGIAGFEVSRKFRTDGTRVFADANGDQSLERLASGLEIKLASGYSFGVTLGKRLGYDYTTGTPGERELTEHDVVYLNKGNRAITGAVLLNTADSNMNVQIPGRAETLKPGQATRLTAVEVLSTMIYTLASAESYDAEVSAPLRALRDSYSRGDELRRGIQSVLEKAATSSKGMSLATLQENLKSFDRGLTARVKENLTGKKVPDSIATNINNRFIIGTSAKKKGDLTEVISALTDDITRNLRDLINGGSDSGYDKAAAYTDILQMVISGDQLLTAKYEDELRSGRRTVFSQVVSSFFQPHESLFRGNQLAYQQPIFEVSGSIASLHGGNRYQVGGDTTWALLSGARLSHYTPINLIEGGEFIRTVQDSSRERRVAAQLMPGGIVFPEGGMTKVTFAEGFMRSTSNLDFLTRTRDIDKKWGRLDPSVRQLIEKANEDLFGSGENEAQQLYYFPYAKTEQISQRIKNKKSERGLLESSVEFTDMMRQLGLGSQNTLSDPSRILGGNVPVALSAEQFDILRTEYGPGLFAANRTDATMRALRDRQLNASEITQGLIGRSEPKMFLLNMGVSTMSDFGYINETASTRRVMIDVQRQEQTFQTEALGPNFHAAVAKTLKKGTMFVAKPYEIEREIGDRIDGTNRINRYHDAAAARVNEVFAEIQAGRQAAALAANKPFTWQTELKKQDLQAINRELRNQNQNISVALTGQGELKYYLNSGVYRNINPGGTRNITDLRRIGELTQDLTFILYDLEKTSIVDGIQKSNYVPIVNSAIARRESRGISFLQEDAALVSSSVSQQILSMSFLTGLEATTGIRPVGFKGPLIGLTAQYFADLKLAYDTAHANRLDLVPNRLKTDLLEGVLAPGQIKDFNFTAGFALLEDPNSGMRGLLNNSYNLSRRAELGRAIAAGLELMLPESGKNFFDNRGTGIGSLNQYEGLAILAAGGETIQQGLSDIVSRVNRNERGAALELVKRTRQLVETSYRQFSIEGPNRGADRRQIIASNRYTRAASLVAILTSMASDLSTPVTAGGENSFSEITFTEHDRQNYGRYLNKELNPQDSEDQKLINRARSQERLAYALKLDLRRGRDKVSPEEQGYLKTDFSYLHNLYSRSIFVRQFFEYGVSRIAVATGMQDTTALEASYARYMTKAQLDVQTFDPKTRDYVTDLQQAIFSLVINTEPLFGKKDAPRFGVSSAGSLLLQGLTKQPGFHTGLSPAAARYQKQEAFALVNSFTNAYSMFGRRDLPDVEESGRTVAQNHVIDVINKYRQNNTFAGRGSGRKLSRSLSTELKQMARIKSKVMSMSLTGTYETDIANAPIQAGIHELLISSLERKVTRERGQRGAINIETPEQELERRYTELQQVEEGKTISDWEQSKRSIYDRIKQTKLSLKTSEGTTYLEGLTVLQRQAMGQLGVVNRQLRKNANRLTRLTRTPQQIKDQGWPFDRQSGERRRLTGRRSYLERQKRDLQQLNRELIKTSVYTLPQLLYVDSDVDRGLGRFVLDNERPVLGAVLGLDILREIKLSFHGYTHNVLEDQARLRGLLAEAEDTGLFRSIVRSINTSSPGSPYIPLTQQQSDLYQKITQQLAASDYNTRELFNNQENLRRLQGDRLKQSGTTFVAFSSFLLGTQEVAYGSRGERVTEDGISGVNRNVTNEISRLMGIGDVDNATELFEALLKNHTGGRAEGLDQNLKAVTTDTDRETLKQFLINESTAHNDQNLKGKERLARALDPLAGVGRVTALAPRTGGPSGSSVAATIPHLTQSVNYLNEIRGNDTKFEYSERLSTTALALPAMGLQYTQLGDYDGDTFQLAFNKLAAVSLEMQRIKTALSKLEREDLTQGIKGDPAREVEWLNYNRLSTKFYKLYLDATRLSTNLEQKAREAQTSFTKNYLFLPEGVANRLTTHQQALAVKQYGDSISGTTAAAEYTRKNFTRYIEHFVDDGLTPKDYDPKLDSGLSVEEYGAEKAHIEELQRKLNPNQQSKAGLIQAEADRVNQAVARQNVSKMLGSAAGSVITDEQLGVLQATIGTTGMGLLGEVYNTVTPMVDLAQGDYLQLRALEDPELSQGLINAFGAIKPGVEVDPELRETMRKSYSQRVSSAYRFSVLTQQFMRDAALKPKEGGGVLELANSYRNNGLYEQLKAATDDAGRKSIYKDFLATTVGGVLDTYDTAGVKSNMALTSFGALTLLQEYVDSGYSARQLIDGESALSGFLKTQQKKARIPEQDPNQLMLDVITDLTDSFQRNYLVKNVIEAGSKANELLLEDLGAKIEDYAGTKDGESYKQLLTDVDASGVTGSERGAALYEGVIRLQQQQDRAVNQEQLRGLRDFKQGLTAYETAFGSEDRVLQEYGQKLTATALAIRRGKATREDVTGYVEQLTEQLPDKLDRIAGMGADADREQALFGLSAMLEVGGLLPSYVRKAIQDIKDPQEQVNAQERYIRALITPAAGGDSTAKRMAELSSFSYLQASVSSKAERLRNEALADPTNTVVAQEAAEAQDQLDRLVQAGPRAIPDDIDLNLSEYSLHASLEAQALQHAMIKLGRAGESDALTKSSQQARRSHNRGEILSVLAIPLLMGSLQGGTMNLEQVGVLASNLVQALPMVSRYEASGLYGAIHGNENLSRTELNRSAAVEAQFFRARSRDFIRANENQLEGLLQATSFEGLSRAAGGVAVGATQAIANRFGNNGFFSAGGMGRGVTELVGGLAGMAVAGVITQRPITGTGGNMGALPDYVLKTLNEISQTVQGAAQRYLQGLLDDEPEVTMDNERVESTTGDIGESTDAGQALSGEIERDWWSGWASQESGNISFDSMESGSEAIELGDSPEIS